MSAFLADLDALPFWALLLVSPGAVLLAILSLAGLICAVDAVIKCFINWPDNK